MGSRFTHGHRECVARGLSAVRIGEQKPFAIGNGDALAHRVALSEPSLAKGFYGDDTKTTARFSLQSAQNDRRAVAAAVVDDDQLVAGIVLIQQAGHAGFNVVFLILGRNDNRDLRSVCRWSEVGT